MSSLMAIEREMLTFIRDIVEREQIDLIVCSERKATAVVRALISEFRPKKFSWEWESVLSTVSVSQFDWASFNGSKVLLFDELVHHGKTLENQEENLRSYLPRDVSLVTAGFAVWDKCGYKPQFSFYSAVDSDTYERIRDSIVYMLQKHGSLLLDTEHIELSARIQCGVKEFYDEVARAAEDGRTYSFVSGANRTNLTVDMPDIICDKKLDQCLTPGSTLDSSVRKIRILERSYEVFSILPIFYPNVRCIPSEEWKANLPDFINLPLSEKGKTAKEMFYVVGLLCSIELLRSTVAALSNLIREGKIVLEVPQRNFPHLHTIFPRVDTQKLCEYVRNMVAESKKTKPTRSKNSVRARNVATDKLMRLSSRVMSSLVNEYDEMIISDESPKGVSWKELMNIAEIENRREGLDPRALTVIVDRLIDGGLVVTDVEEVINREGLYCIRTFTPEGEIVSSKIRQQLMVRDPECLLAT